MGLYLDPKNEKFQRALRSQIYVDKSGLLEYTNSVLGTEQACLCVSRPRRFGKSITAAMLAAYYSCSCDSKELFQNLAVGKTSEFEKHLNQYHVIHVDINTFRFRRDIETGETITAIKAVGLFHMEVIQELKKAFPDIITENDGDLPFVLAKINEITGEQFIIIDEWDLLFREDKFDERAQKAYIELLRGLFKVEKKSFQPCLCQKQAQTVSRLRHDTRDTSKEFLKLGYITGILPVKKYGTESALNNFEEFTMIQPDMLAKYIGFTEDEVSALYNAYGMEFEEAKRWYDGYIFSEGIHIYNPKSVTDSIRRKKIANYWTNTETYESLQTYICMNFDGLKNAIVKMMVGESCHIDTNTFENDMISFQNRDDVLTILIHLGYLAYDADTKLVSIPNEEVRTAFTQAVKKGNWNYVVQAISASDQLLYATWNQDENAVAKGIEKVHMENASILQYHDENSISCVISLAYYNAVNEYTLIREFPTGKGYADIVFLPRHYSNKPAMIVELKYDQCAECAISQIKEKHYWKALEEYKGNLLLVGINYDKKTKKYQCNIEKMNWR